jgi:hypothetical protein
MVSPQSGWGDGGRHVWPLHCPASPMRARSSVPLREIMMTVSVCPCQSVSVRVSPCSCDRPASARRAVSDPAWGHAAACPRGIPGTPWTPRFLTFGNGVPAIRAGGVGGRHMCRPCITPASTCGHAAACPYERSCRGFRGHHSSWRLGMVSPQSGWGDGGRHVWPLHCPASPMRARSSVPLREVMQSIGVRPCLHDWPTSERGPGHPVRRRGTLPRARGGFRGHHGHHSS